MQHDRPDILTIDCDAGVRAALQSYGFKTESGRLGDLYEHNRTAQYTPFRRSCSLSNLAEKDLVFLDLKPRKRPSSDGDLWNINTVSGYWAKPVDGYIDDRIRTGIAMSGVFLQVMSAGGLIVVFAGAPLRQEVAKGKLHASSRAWQPEDSFEATCWRCLAPFESDNRVFNLISQSGEYIQPLESLEFPLLGDFMVRHAVGARYECAFSTREQDADFWVPLARNKLNQDVAGVCLNNDDRPLMLVLPQVADKCGAITELVQEILPSIVPHLFPEIEKAAWSDSSAYELNKVTQMREEVVRIRKDADEKVSALESLISAEVTATEFLTRILTGTGDSLVDDLEAVLKMVGFKNIVNVDRLVDGDEPQGDGNKQEDIQILDREESLIVEAKGLGGLPKEKDTLQVHKYVNRRMKEWKSTDVRGISIVNAQRHLPLDQRDQEVFSEQQVQDALADDILLVDTRSLYKLARGMHEYNWDPSCVQDLFHRAGLMSSIPTHYAVLGHVDNYFAEPDALIVDLEVEGLRVGEKLAFDNGHCFVEAEVESIMLNDNSVQEATMGQKIGVRLQPSIGGSRVGTVVYKRS